MSTLFDKYETGTIFQTKDGNWYILVRHENKEDFINSIIMGITKDQCLFINSYNQNLKSNVSNNLNIVRIAKFPYFGDVFFTKPSLNNLKILWEDKKTILENDVLNLQKCQDAIDTICDRYNLDSTLAIEEIAHIKKQMGDLW